MTQKIIVIDPAEFDSILIQFKPKEVEHIKGELGIDVSRHNGQINWDGMLAAGVGFAGIRATLGASGRDEQFRRNWSEARRVGIQRMAYHYFINNTTGKAQIENLLAALGSDLGELPMVLDVERATGQEIPDRDRNTREIAVWLTECESRTGIRPIIYTNKSAWDICTNVPAWSNTYKLWHAQYTSAPFPKVNLPWTTCQIWQYSSTGNLAGSNPIDLNRWGPY